jgi:oligosaccharide repeat unit polymerase
MSAHIQFDGNQDIPKTLDSWPFKLAIAVSVILILCLVIALLDLRWYWLSTVLLAMAATAFVVVKVSPTFDLLHPVRVFGALWCFCLALNAMRLLPIISDWNLLMWTCVTTGLISFIAGFVIAQRLWREPVTASAGRTPEDDFQNVFLPNGRTLAISAVCILVGTAVLGYEFHLIGGIPILADNIDQLRMELFGTAGTGNPAFDTLFIKSIHFLVDFVKYGVFFAFIVLVQNRMKNRRVALASALLVLIGTLVYISQAGRMFLIEIIVTCAVLFHYLRRKIRVVELTAAVMVIFILLGTAGALRTQTGTAGSIIDRVRSGSNLPEGQFWDGIGFGYLTLTESFEVFYRLTTDLRTTTRPREGFLFYNVHRIIPRANIQELTLNLYSGLFVTPTYMGEFYADFGVPGILFGSLALGMLYGWVYLQSRVPNPIFWLVVRGMFIQMIFFFPYVNLFSQYLNWLVDPIFMYLLIRLASPRGLDGLKNIGHGSLPSEAT